MRIFLVVALVVVAAGCFGKDEAPAARAVSASGGKVSQGWDYAGVATTPGAASLSGSLNDPDDSGSLNASFDYHGAKWTVQFDQFAASKDFMDGGVEFDITEHGDTGVADASIPRIHAKVAAWGTALVTKDGKPVVGKAGDRWAAHVMVSDDTVRGSDNKILNAGGTAPYDPAKGGDARISAGDAQALLKLVHPDGEGAARPPLNVSSTLDFQGPETTKTVAIPSEQGAVSLTLNLTAVGSGPTPLGLGKVTLRLLDAGGNATKAAELTLAPNQPNTVSWSLTAAEVTGPFTLEAKGTGAFSLKTEAIVVFDDHPFLTLTWDEVTLS